MQTGNCSILSIAPYKVLPPRNGGHLGIVYPHHYLGLLCDNHLAGTTDNEQEHGYAFHLHRIFPPSPVRYLPYYGYGKLLELAKQVNAQYIYCDHPYMMLTALRLAATLGVKCFMRSHNIESQRFKSFGKAWWKVMFRFERYVMRKAAGNFFVTPEEAQWAEKNYGIPASKCHFIPFGTTLEARPVVAPGTKEQTAQELGADPAKPWLYFLGALDYSPNREAVEYILNEISPRLEKAGIQYELFITGKGLSEELQQKISKTANIHYTGFIPDLDLFLKSCDVMLNPVLTGGGIKTKAVEALGYNKMVVSSDSGAAGLLPSACGNNLLASPDHDWNSYAANVIKAIGMQANIPGTFYDTYYWGNIMKKVLDIMQHS